MKVIEARNVNDAYAAGMQLLFEHGVRRSSRAGEVLEAPWPVTTVYSHPLERVLFDERRHANPFLHLIEAIWMLQGRSDVATLAEYASNMVNFSDDGVRLAGAYGARWRCGGQLSWLAALLRSEPDTRRAVLQMWFASDLPAAMRGARDVPCNTHCYFRRDPDGKLHLTVCCRSNDIIWGAYGSNMVTFSVLLEYVAALVGCPMGNYTQVSNSYHAYSAEFAKRWPPERGEPLYGWTSTLATPLFAGGGTSWVEQARLTAGAMEGRAAPGLSFDATAGGWLVEPMVEAWAAHKRRDYPAAMLALAELPAASDWRLAATAWLERTRAAWEARNG